MQKLKSTLFAISKPLRLVVCLGLMVYILVSIDYSRISQIQGQIHYPFIILLIGATLLEDFLKAFKWHYLLQLHGVRLKSTEILHVDYACRFMNLFVPSTISQDVFRYFSLSKAVPEKEKTLSSIMMDRILGMFSLVTLVTFGAVASFGESPFSKAILTVSVAALGVLVLLLATLFIRPLGNLAVGVCRRFKDLRYLSFVAVAVESLLRYRLHPSGMALVFCLSVAVQFLRILQYFFSAQALGFTLVLQNFIFYTPIVTFFSMLPISLSGLGVREASFAFFFSRIGVPATEAFLIPAIVSVKGLFFSILPGGLLITFRGFSARKAS